MEWAMTTYSNGEAHGAKAFTWTVIAATALLLMEVTWPQAFPAAPAAQPTAQVVTNVGHVDRVARAN
jgi:hypothetical protein